MNFVIGGILIISICLNIYCLLKRRERSTIVSEIPMEVHYDEIGTINGNSANVRALSNNVLEAEIIVDGPAIGRVRHHLSSIELSTSSEYSAHNSQVHVLVGTDMNILIRRLIPEILKYIHTVPYSPMYTKK